MTAAKDHLPLFEPPELGLDVETWDELDQDITAERPKCSECDRPLRSPESLDAGIGPCCAAKIGRAVMQRRRAEREKMSS